MRTKWILRVPVLLVTLLLAAALFSQELEIVGSARISDMEKDNSADSVVVRLADGTLAVRDVSTLAEYQMLSMKGDTIFLQNGGFVLLKDSSSTNEKITNLTITGDSLFLTEGGMTMTAKLPKELPSGTSIGDRLLWNGSKWVVVSMTDVFNPITGKVWMDRNLGASQVATSSTDSAAYGDLYQWGRAADGHQIRTSMTTGVLSGSDSPGHGDFILAPSSPFDWRSPQNDTLWQGVSGINNPCPTGYRLPTESEWEAERLTWSSNDAAGAFASPLKLPLAGSRLGSEGFLLLVGTLGHYWSSTVSGTFPRYLYFLSSSAGWSTSHRVNGYSVRCLKD